MPSGTPHAMSTPRSPRSEVRGTPQVEGVVFGPGAWAFLPAEVRDTFARNATTFLEEREDPECEFVDLAALAGGGVPVHLTVQPVPQPSGRS